jgi:hypothetical protein
MAENFLASHLQVINVMSKKQDALQSPAILPDFSVRNLEYRKAVKQLRTEKFC